jgi:hypothetical protein
MCYEEIVEIIKMVTGLEVPVYFNDLEATGSPYFGLGEHSWDIMPEEFMDCPFCDVEDFIENKHLHYYHVGLPSKILRKNEEYIYRVTSEQLKQSGIKIRLTELLMETFIILHEFGHAHQLYISYNGDVEKYMCDTSSVSQSNSYMIKADGLAGTERGLLMHKELSTEKYADNFALKYFKQVAELVK